MTVEPRISERSLITRARGGDTSAVGELCDRHAEAVYRYAFYRLHGTAEAETITREVFRRALREISRYDDGQSFVCWLYRIARRAVLDHLRAEGRGRALHAPDADTSAPAAVRAALASMPALQQDVAVLGYVEGFDTQEISRITGRRDTAVRAIRARAADVLRPFMERPS